MALQAVRILGWCLLLLAWAAPVYAQKTPVINKISDINVGAIHAGANTGTITLESPSASRHNTGGTELSTAATVRLGSLTLTGKAGNSWSIAKGSALPFTLARVGGGTLTVTAVDFEPSTTNTGVFPHSGTTAKFFLGVTIAVGNSATTPQGNYTGSFLLLLRDTTNNGKQSTQVFTVTVHVDPVITLSSHSGLGFGDIFAGRAAGQVVLNPEGTRTARGPLYLGDNSVVSAATFTVNGAPYAAYSILLPSSITLTGPSGTMVVSRFTSSPEESGFLNEAGQQELKVGATLNLSANQSDGDYRGTFAVTVTYN
jgi:hypothetical protein